MNFGEVMRKSQHRLAAWITIQALVFTQVVPPSAWAGEERPSLAREQLRGQAGRESGTASGLESALTAGLAEPDNTPLKDAGGQEETVGYAELLTLAMPKPPVGDAWKGHPNFKSLERIFGSPEAAEEAVLGLIAREDPEGRRGLTPYHAVQGLLHPDSLNGFLSRASPQDPSGEWARLWQDRDDGAVGFALEQLSKVSADALDFGGGSSIQTNSQVSRGHPLLDRRVGVGVTNNSDNGGRTRDIFNILLGPFGPTERAGDVTAGIKGGFSPAVQETLLEPDHEGIWRDSKHWSRLGPDAGSFRARVELLLAEFASQPGWPEIFDREERIPFLRMAVELLNIAALTDQHYVAPGRLDVNLPSVRHMIRNAVFAGVGAYDGKRRTIDQGRYWVGDYLAAQAFGPLIMVNSTAAQELHAEWVGSDGEVRSSMETITTPAEPGSAPIEILDRGQVAISLYPDARRNDEGVVDYRTFGVIDPEAAGQKRVVPIDVPPDGVLEMLIRHARPGAMIRFGPSSWFASLLPILLPSYAKIVAKERPDLAGTLVLNLTRNSETGGWSLRNYVESWEEHTGYPLQETVKYLLVNTRWPRKEAFGEARALALAAGEGKVLHYPKALKQFDPSTPACKAALDRLRDSGVESPEDELVLALALSDHGDSRATYKNRGGVPILSTEELEELRRRGITVILDDFTTTWMEQYVPGEGRGQRRGVGHDKGRLGRAYAWIAEEQKRRIDRGETPSQGGIHDFSRFPLEPFDLLDLQAMGPPLAEILCDLDETGAPDRDASVSDETVTLVGEYARLGGGFHWLSNRDEENITRRGRVEEIRSRAGKRAEARVGLHAGSGMAHPALQGLVAGRGLGAETLQQALAQVTGQAQPDAVYPGDATGNPAHTVCEYGNVALYLPKAGSPPGTMAIYAYRPAVDTGRMTKQEAQVARRKLRAALMKTGLFPEGQVWLQYAGTTSLNVEVAGKADLIREVYLNDPGRQGRIAVLDDEALPGFSGYAIFTLDHPDLVQIAVDRTKTGHTLPERVIRSGRQGPEALNRLLKIEIAKRRAMRRLHKGWGHVAARIAMRPPGQSAVQALFDLAAGRKEGAAAVAMRLQIPADQLTAAGTHTDSSGWRFEMFRGPAGELSVAAQAPDGRWLVPIVRNKLVHEAGLPQLELWALRRALLTSPLFPPDSPARRAVDWVSQIPAQVEIRIHRRDLPDKARIAAERGIVPHSYLHYSAHDPKSGREIVSLMLGFSPESMSPHDVILADVSMNQAEFGHTGLDLQLLKWVLAETIHPSVTQLGHRHYEDPEERELALRIAALGEGQLENKGRVPFEGEESEIPRYEIKLPFRGLDAKWWAGNLPTEEEGVLGRPSVTLSLVPPPQESYWSHLLGGPQGAVQSAVTPRPAAPLTVTAAPLGGVTSTEAYSLLPEVMQGFRGLGGIEYVSAAPSTTGIVVDLSGDPTQTAAGLFVPPGVTVVVASVDALLDAEKLTGRTAEDLGISVFFVDQRGYEAALGGAINVMAGMESVEVNSNQPPEQVQAAVGPRRGVLVKAGLTTRQILMNLGAVAGAALNWLIGLLEAAAGLAEYV